MPAQRADADVDDFGRKHYQRPGDGGVCGLFVVFVQCRLYATQYALLSSLMTLARDVFAATSGFMAAAVSWPMFFTITSVMALPGLLLLLYIISKEGSIGGTETNEKA